MLLAGDCSVIILSITVGILLSAGFLGLGICLGREYERLSKRELFKSNNSNNVSD